MKKNYLIKGRWVCREHGKECDYTYFNAAGRVEFDLLKSALIVFDEAQPKNPLPLARHYDVPHIYNQAAEGYEGSDLSPDPSYSVTRSIFDLERTGDGDGVWVEGGHLCDFSFEPQKPIPPLW